MIDDERNFTWHLFFFRDCSNTFTMKNAIVWWCYSYISMIKLLYNTSNNKIITTTNSD